MNARRLLTASIAPNSQFVYRNALSAFEAFCRAYNIEISWPVPVPHVSLFIAYCFENGYSPATVSSYISGLSFYHKIRNLPDPTSAFIIKKLLEGFRRSDRRHDVRAPITMVILKQICSVLPTFCYSEYECSLFKAAYLLAYHALLPVSEIVFSNHIQANRPLLASDLQLVNEASAIQVTIRISKTNQSGVPTILLIPRSHDTASCCVQAMQHYLRFRPPGPQYLFCHQNGTPLTRYQFSSVLAKAVRQAGLLLNYSSHSFRIGRATDLAAMGVTTEKNMELGRWRSKAVTRYIRP